MHLNIINKNASGEVIRELNKFRSRLHKLESNNDFKPSENNKGPASLIKNNKIIQQLAIITLLTMVLMTGYEIVKQFTSPQITIWQSHLITILFASIIAPIISYFALKKIDLLRHAAKKELNDRKEIEKELQLTQLNLEKRVEKRTWELQEANNILRQEIKVRKEAERAFRESEERYELLFRNSPVGFFHFNSDLFVTAFNNKFLEIFETTSEKVKSLNLGDLKDKSFRSALESALNGKEGHFEGLYRASTSDAICYISLITAPYFTSNSIVKGGIGIVENINERKLAEKTLLEAKEKAEKSNSMKSEFLALMSHEIRTPLNSMLNFVNLLNDDMFDKVDDDLKPGFGIIENSGRRIIRTIDLILNMSEIQAGSYEYTPTIVDIYQDVLIDLFAEFKPIADKKSIELSLFCETNKTIVKADVFALLQIFSHLIDNAVKFTEKGTVKIHVCLDDKNDLLVSVRDTGIGMSKEYLINLFKPFSQEEQGYTRRFEGCGLGLSLANKYCELMNANLSVNSLKGVGSSFTVTFPSSIMVNPT